MYSVVLQVIKHREGELKTTEEELRKGELVRSEALVLSLLQTNGFTQALAAQKAQFEKEKKESEEREAVRATTITHSCVQMFTLAVEILGRRD